MTRAWAHLHLPRARRGDADLISVKVGQAPTGYVAYLALSDVRFVVRQAGRARMLREGRKNVHAFVTGAVVSAYPASRLTPILAWVPDAAHGWRRASYNPMRNASFVDAESGESVSTARYAVMHGRTVWYQP